MSDDVQKKLIDEAGKIERVSDEGVGEEAAISNVQERLAKLGFPVDDKVTPDDEDGNEEVEDEEIEDEDLEDEDEDIEDDDDELEEDEDGGEDEDEEEDEDGEPQPKKKKKKPETPKLDHALRRAAIHQGWTDDDIERALNADAEGAMKTFKKMHESTNKLSAKFAQLGQNTLNQQIEQQNAPAHPTNEFEEELKAVKEEHGEDSATYKAMKKMADKASSAVPAQEVRQQQVEIPEESKAQVLKSIDQFMSDEDITMDGEFYGRTDENLTPIQTMHRRELFNLADKIRTGAMVQGEDMSVLEALEFAHMAITAPVMEDKAVKKTQKKLKKRNDSRTFRAKGKTNQKGPQKKKKSAEEQALDTADKGLKKLRAKGF